jgi:hypothetical protein
MSFEALTSPEALTSLEVIRLDDGNQAVSVRLADRVPAWAPDHYAADIVVTSDFVDAQLRVLVTLEGLDRWAEALDRTETEERRSSDDGFTVDWPPTGNDGYFRFIADDPCVVEIHGAPQTQISVNVPLDLDEGWIPEARERLRLVRALLGPNG